MKMKISPSMMCADMTDLKNTLSIFEKNSIEYLHIDVMDGSFVPNFALGTDYCKDLKKITTIPFDIHLMIDNPEDKISWFPIDKGDMVSVHYESSDNIRQALEQIKETGAKAFLAIKPDTPIDVINKLDDVIDGVLVMTVNPGFAGQKLVPHTLDKITKIREHFDASGYSDKEIQVDGNVSFENAEKMKKAGANIFVAGSSSVFDKNMSLEEGTKKLRKIISE